MNQNDIDITSMEITMVYIHELYSLCEAIVRETDEIFSEAVIPEKYESIQVSPVLHSRINSVLLYSANIKKLIKTPKTRRNNESKKRFELRQQRNEIFDDLLKNIEINEIFNSKVRNTLEHFEEHLDKLNLKLSEPNSKIKNEYSGAVYNIAFSDWKALKYDVYPIRLYIVKEQKFYNFEWSIDIGKIAKEAKEIKNRLEQIKDFKDKDSGGLIKAWSFTLKIHQEEGEDFRIDQEPDED